MKNDQKSIRKKFSKTDFYPSRRRFIKKVGVGMAAASTYSVISLSHFSCSSSTSPNDFTSSGYYEDQGYPAG